MNSISIVYLIRFIYF